jgi:predicted PurR-regulated permease PerM
MQGQHSGEGSGPAVPPPARPLPEFRDLVETLLRLGALAFLLYLCLRTVAPFAAVIAWGVILAVALHPFHATLSRRLGGRAKTAATVIAVLLLAVPIGLVAVLSESIATGAMGVKAALDSGQIELPHLGRSLTELAPRLGQLVQPALENLAAQSQAILAWLMPHLRTAAAALAGAVGRGSLGLLQLAAGAIVAAALLVYASSLTATARRLAAALVGGRGDAFLALATGTIRSVAKGVIGVAFIQATLAGIGMFAIGVPGAGFWSLLALILAIVQLPVVVLLLPMIFWAFHALDTLPAALFAGWAVVVGVSDNILKPLLLGRGVDVPMLVVFIGSIGGMITGGITWLFIGPVVLAIGYTIMKAWTESMPEPGSVTLGHTTSKETPT